MADGLSEDAEVLLGEAADLTEGKGGFEDLRTIDPHSSRSMELETVNNTDASLYIIYYGEGNDYLVIWNG